MEEKTLRHLLLVLFVGVLMGALDIAIVGPALPIIRQEFGVDDRAMSWVFALYVLFNLISVPLMAKLSDMFGRRSIYILDVALFAFGSLIVALAPMYGVLLFGRALQGFGAGGILPVASAVIGDAFPPERRGSALGLIGAVFGIAFLFGPLLAGVMLTFLSWHWLFIINLPIALAVIMGAMRIPLGTPVVQAKSFDGWGMLVLGLGVAALSYGINQLDTKNFLTSITSLNVLPYLVVALVSVPLFILVEQRASHPLINMKLLQRRQVLLVGVISAGAGLGESAIAFVPALLVATFGVSSGQASFMLLPAVLAMAVGSPTAGRMLDKYGSRLVLFLGNVLTTLGLVSILLLNNGVMFFYLSAILAGLGLGTLLGAPLRYVMLNETVLHERAAAQGILTLNTSVGQLVGGAMVGAVAASFGGGNYGYTFAFLIVGAIMAVMVVLTLGLKNRSAELATAKQNFD